jgi:hypothetical protein
MKKIFFLIFALSVFSLNLISLLDARAEEVQEKRWMQVWCADKVHNFEVCVYGGDGNKCLKGGATTRSCPDNPN